ncbi:DExH-box ATP-dependent RNA helicase DExH1 [Drosophila guanche]|uniref:Blast:ATP-dependent RNA helicase A n=1 Tax=Drosophila guanche TaxID=7266 RepID=A0A3B0JZ05_DROGU|nr:DExH-box ATP-dependent RNA helicase DExH1 [Drosophila guanche]SPP77961.1 blast:ATP-dependent RNA helicase A [Drosophila guanche]
MADNHAEKTKKRKKNKKGKKGPAFGEVGKGNGGGQQQPSPQSSVNIIALTLSVMEKNLVMQLLAEFLASNKLELKLEGMNNEQRSLIHSYAQSMGLKSVSRGPTHNRVLSVTRSPGSSLHHCLDAPVLLVNSKVTRTLASSVAKIERVLAAAAHKGNGSRADLNRQRNGFGLVGVRQVPPHPDNQNNPLYWERTGLPIFRYRTMIQSILQQHQVLVVKGSTGSGKSTQVPQYVLEWAADTMNEVRIVVSQPRRIAAISVSERISKERGELPGGTVGYQIRMNSNCTSHTVLTLTTSGCLLRALTMDTEAFFETVTHLIIDEVHERDLDTDFLLLVIKLELQKNPYLRVILMSATMDLDALSAYFGNVPVLDVEGRSFGVRIFQMEQILSETGYMTAAMKHILGEKIDTATADELLHAYILTRYMESDIDNNLIVSLLELLTKSGEKGAVIVYLPGYNDMTSLMECLYNSLPADKIQILLLHSQVENHEQKKIFRNYPNVQLTIILSTNIGQTSITIPELVYVIDVGKSKMKIYDAKTNAAQLATTPISQADAQQRAGRAGRIRDGICYRLYSSEQFAKMNIYTIPEIQRRTLDEICLLTKVAAPEQSIPTFLSQALDAPQPEAVNQACSRLKLLGVLQDTNESITMLGRIIAELPLSVQMGKCVVYSIYYRCLGSMSIIAAFHSVRDPFVLPVDRRRSFFPQEARLKLTENCHSDLIGMISLYKQYTDISRRGHKELAQFCELNYLCSNSMAMFVSAVSTLRESVCRIFKLDQTAKRHASANDRDNNMLRLALTAGLYPNLAYYDYTKHELVAECDPNVLVSRNSCLLGKKKMRTLPSEWVLYVEKTRVSEYKSSLEQTSLVSTLHVAIAGGKELKITKRPSSSPGLLDTAPKGQLCIDHWVRIGLHPMFGEQLITLRALIKREVDRMVMLRRMDSCIGPEIVRSMLSADEGTIALN